MGPRRRISITCTGGLKWKLRKICLTLGNIKKHSNTGKVVSSCAKLQNKLLSEYNQENATYLKFIYFCKTLYMFQTVFPSIIRSTKLHIQRQEFVRPLLLPAANLARLAAGSSNGLTNA